MQVHPIQGFLHMLHAAGGAFHQRPAVPLDGPQAAHGVLRTERGVQQPVGVQLPDPFAVHQVALAPSRVFGLPRIDQDHAKPSLLQPLVDRQPIHPRGLHGHVPDLALLQPLHQFIEVRRARPKTPLAGRGAVRTDRHPVLSTPDIDAGRFGMLDLPIRFRLGAAALWATASAGLARQSSRGRPRRRSWLRRERGGKWIGWVLLLTLLCHGRSFRVLLDFEVVTVWEPASRGCLLILFSGMVAPVQPSQPHHGLYRARKAPYSDSGS